MSTLHSDMAVHACTPPEAEAGVGGCSIFLSKTLPKARRRRKEKQRKGEGGKGRREKEQAREGKKKRNYLPADLIIHLFFSVTQHYNKHPGFLPVPVIFRLGTGGWGGG